MNVSFRVMRRSGDKAYILSEITGYDKRLPVVLTASTEAGVHIPSDSFPYWNSDDDRELFEVLSDAALATRGGLIARPHTKNTADVRFFVVVLPWLDIRKWVLEFQAVDATGEVVSSCIKRIDTSSAIWLDKLNDFTNQHRGNAIEGLDGSYIHDRIHVHFLRAVEEDEGVLVTALAEMPYHKESVIEFDFLDGAGQPKHVDYHIIEDSIDRAVGYGTLDRRYTMVTFLVDKEEPSTCVCITDTAGQIAPGFAMLGAHCLYELIGSTYNLTIDADEDPDYDYWFDTYHRVDLPTLLEQVAAHLDYTPLLSLVIYVAQSPMHHLFELAQSLLAQSYGKWELILVNDGSQDTVLNDLMNSLQDDRIFAVRSTPEASFGEYIQAGIDAAEGEFIGFIRPSNKLAPDALFEFVRKANDNELCDMIYCDADIYDMQGVHSSPTLRPDFSPELLRSTNYIRDFIMIRSGVMHAIGDLSQFVDGAFFYDLVLRSTEAARQVCHVPRVLCHKRYATTNLPADYDVDRAQEAGRRALVNHCQRVGIKAEVLSTNRHKCYYVRHVLTSTPLVSVIIPTQDNAQEVLRCLLSIKAKIHYTNFEVLVLDGGSTNPNTWKTYKEITERFSRVQVVTIEDTSNRADFLNQAVAQAKGEFLLFLNDDVRVLTEDALEAMLGYFQLDDVGVVGAKRLFIDNTVEHAGLLVGGDMQDRISTPLFKFMPNDWEGYQHRAQLAQNVSAVSGDCMMVRRSMFDEVGGFTSEFATFYSHLDFCLKAQQAGYYVVFTPQVILSHFKSISQTHTYSEELSLQLRREAAYFQYLWPRIFAEGDPYSNPNLDPTSPYFALKW